MRKELTYLFGQFLHTMVFICILKFSSPNHIKGKHHCLSLKKTVTGFHLHLHCIVSMKLSLKKAKFFYKFYKRAVVLRWKITDLHIPIIEWVSQLWYKPSTELGCFAGLQATAHRSHRVSFMVQGKGCQKLCLRPH